MRRRSIFAIAAVAAAAGSVGYASADVSGTTINGCYNTGTYVVRIRPTAACVAGETAVSGGIQGPKGDTGPAGSPDTPQQVLDKIVQVDGQGSGLDSSFLDGIDSTGFLRNNGKAVDADKLDGINSTAFLKRGTISGGVIGLSAVSANKCSDVQLGLGSVKVNDIVVLN